MNSDLADAVRRTAAELCRAMTAAFEAGLEVEVFLQKPGANNAPAHPLYGQFSATVVVKRTTTEVY